MPDPRENDPADAIAELAAAGEAERAATPQPLPPEPAAPLAPWVDRARGQLRLATIGTAGLSIIVVVILVALGVVGLGLADNALDGPGGAIVWIMTLGSPALFVIALNLLLWRALLPSLSRRPRAEAIMIVVIVVLVLAVVSVLLVAALLFAGFAAAAAWGI